MQDEIGPALHDGTRLSFLSLCILPFHIALMSTGYNSLMRQTPFDPFTSNPCKQAPTHANRPRPDLLVRNLMPPLISSNAATDFSKHVVPMLQRMTGSVAMGDLHTHTHTHTHMNMGMGME